MLSFLGSIFGYNAANTALAEQEAQLQKINEDKQREIDKLNKLYEQYQQKIQAVYSEVQDYKISLPTPLPPSSTSDPSLTDETIKKYQEIVALGNIITKLKSGQLEKELDEMNNIVGKEKARAEFLEREVEQLSRLNDSMEKWNDKRQRTSQLIGKILEDANSK